MTYMIIIITIITMKRRQIKGRVDCTEASATNTDDDHNDDDDDDDHHHHHHHHHHDQVAAHQREGGLWRGKCN